jgi:catechol-2,3-dioxygenase
MHEGGHDMAAKVQLGHIGVPAHNPRHLAAFYHELLGLEVTMEGALPALGEFVFLSDRPGEEPQTLAFMTRPDARHIAWKVESVAALKAVYTQAKAHGIAIDRVLNHRASLSLYLHDPEGNGIEIYWPTGQTVTGLFAEPVDIAQLEQPDSALLELVIGSNPA